jgi:hypothetical protein
MRYFNKKMNVNLRVKNVFVVENNGNYFANLELDLVDTKGQ